LARKIIKQTASFGVLRGNPRISGNVKITVDSTKDIWLNSIDSNDEMSNDIYKAFSISPDSNYDSDLYRFFREGETPPQFVFGLFGENDSVSNQIDDLDLVYNFRYSCGVSPLISDKYNEEFSYFAPFWLGEDIPDHFVIFRVDDPIDYSYRVPVDSLEVGKNYKVIDLGNIDSDDYVPFQISSGLTTYNGDSIFDAQFTSFTVTAGIGEVIILDPLFNESKVENVSSHFHEKILPKSTLVATYDLGENSKIGKYLRNIRSNPGFSENLIDVRYEENQLTTFNGVNFENGIFDKKGDYLYDYFTNPETQIGFEEFITDGFRRNGIISYKLLNLEFLFDDIDSPDYSINRYYGMYVNSPEISKFRLGGDRFYNNQGSSGNTPIPKRNDKGYYYDNIPFYQYNNDGVRLFLDPTKIEGIIPNSDDVNIYEDKKIFWIKDKFGDFRSLKRAVDYGESSPTNNKFTYGLSGNENEIVIQDTRIDLSSFTGENTNTRKQYSGLITGEKGRAYGVIKIEGELSVVNDDCFVFYNPLGIYGLPGERYDLIRSSDLSSLIDEWEPGSYYAEDGAYYYNPNGTPEQIANSLAGVFNSFNYNSFEAFASNNEVVIRTLATGTRENDKYDIDFFQDFTTQTRMPDTRSGIVKINDKDVSDINQKQKFLGGSKYSNTRIKIKIEDANKIEVNETYIATNLGSSKVIGKYRFVDQYATDTNSNIVGLKDFETHATIEIENFTHSVSLGSSKKISVFENYKIPLGVFSFYGLREIDGDFWESEYGYTPTEEYYKYLDVQPGGETKIIPDKTYFVSAGTEISYNSTNYVGPDFFEGISGAEDYELITTSPTEESNVYPTLSSRGIVASLPVTTTNFDTNFYPDLDAFPGFSGVQKLNFIDDETGLDTKSSQLFFGKLDSEYDYTEDNYTVEYATKSRVNPYISKWSYRGGTDIRGNEYRMNANIAFTPLNFSPSFFNRTQNPQYFTHEWLQLQRPPFSIPEKKLHRDKSYLAGEIDLNNIKNANPSDRDYFLDYFTVEGEDLTAYYPNNTDTKNINFTERFTILDYNASSGFSETLFRGAKVRIKRGYKDYSGNGEDQKYLSDDTFYEGYKFSSVIVPIRNIEEQIQSPINIRIIENSTFKTITFVVEVLVEEGRTLNYDDISPEDQYIDLDYFLLYSLKDKLDKTNVPTTSPVGDIELANVSDIKLSASLNITTFPNQAGLVSNVNTGGGKIYIVSNTEYETDLRDEINLVYPASIDTSTVSYSATAGSFYGIDNPGDPTNVYTFPAPIEVGQEFISFAGINGANYQFDFTSIGLPAPQTIPTPTTLSVAAFIPIYQREGGIGYWKNILEKISFANLSLLVNTNNTYIKYESYEWDEATKSTISKTPNFSLEFIRPSAFEQNTVLYPVFDTDKPQEISLQNIGYDVEQLNQKSELYRYSGGYVPKFREVLHFENIKMDLPMWTAPENYNYFIKYVDKEEDYNFYDLGNTKTVEIDGTPQKNITLVKGVEYYLDTSDSSNNGYQIYFSASVIGNNYAEDAIDDGYSVIGTPGTVGSGISIEVPYNWPNDVYLVTEGGKYMGVKLNVVDSIEYSYCTFGPDRDNFGLTRNLNYYKYSDQWIFKIGQDSSFEPRYNLIGETPVDRRNLSIFESSWDPGFYREYTDSTNYIGLPGTKNMREKKSFFGSKVMQTPASFNSQKQIINTESINDVLNININNFPDIEIAWEETDKVIRGIILGDRILKRYFLNDGAKEAFRKYIVPEFGFGDLSGIDDDFNDYIEKNVIPTYQTKNNGTYIKKVPVSPDEDLFPIESQLADYQKTINGYNLSQSLKYIKVDELRYEFILVKDPSFDYSISFSIEIGKI
jgi:hypothetical protein